MNSKRLIWFGMFVGYTVGSYIPNLWGSGLFSVTSVVFGAAGALIGIWLGFKLGQ